MLHLPPYANREEAYERIALALRTNPSSSRAHGIRGTYLIFDGQPLEARDAFFTALRLNPCDPINANLRPFIAVSYYFERDYARAVKAAKHAIAQHPEYPLTYRWLAAALGRLNRRDEAGDALRKAIEVSPKSFEFYTRNRPPWIRPEDYAHMLEGLRHGAGLATGSWRCGLWCWLHPRFLYGESWEWVRRADRTRRMGWASGSSAARPIASSVCRKHDARTRREVATTFARGVAPAYYERDDV